MKAFLLQWKIYLNGLIQYIADKRLGVLAAKMTIRLYQVVASPLLGPVCRFSPSCSQYSLTAIERHGIRKGVILSIRRIIRCHPWNAGGFDPVP